MKTDRQYILMRTGLSEKASRVYLAAYDYGEALSVLTLSKISGIKRTSIYYVLKELLHEGLLFQKKTGKKIRYSAEKYSTVITRAHEQLSGASHEIGNQTLRRYSPFEQPHVYFLNGPKGFKQIWDKVFETKKKEYRIIANTLNFIHFVKERYIIEHIIRKKKLLGIHSKQIVVDSAYSRKVTAKDKKENRISKFLPSSTKIDFTEIITDTMVAFISTRFNNNLFIIENKEFAHTRQVLFDELWKKLPDVYNN